MKKICQNIRRAIARWIIAILKEEYYAAKEEYGAASQSAKTAKGEDAANIEADSIVLRNGKHSVRIGLDDEGRLIIRGDLSVTGDIRYFCDADI